MPSTNKTPNFNLNQWRETDKPTRSDFVSDNSIIDAVLGAHTSDTSVHLTAAEKLRASSPYLIKIVQGTGESSRTVGIGFVPELVICFALDMPIMQTVNGVETVNCSIAVRNYGGSGGCEISNTTVLLNQGTVGGIMYNLNNDDVQYIVVAFR